MARPYTGPGRLAALASDESGAAAVEFALLAPVLFLLAAGAIDTARLIAQTMQVRAAAQAGADYAIKKGWDAAAVQGAVTAATPLTVTPAASLSTGCVSGQNIVPASGVLCPDAAIPGQFVTVTAQAAFRALAPWDGVILPASLNGQAVVRVQ